ncbi:MAG: hypothetical protein JSS34_08910 [Proteobacteria bacterium]|nr:hypothetical protein [Pseudomonadota bacterium]
MINHQKIKKKLHNIVSMLVSRKYSDLKENGFLGNLKTKEVEEAINSYPGDMTLPTMKEFDQFHLYPYNTNSFYLEFNLFFNNKKSDLTLSLEGVQKNGNIILKLQDIRVL